MLLLLLETSLFHQSEVLSLSVFVSVCLCLSRSVCVCLSLPLSVFQQAAPLGEDSLGVDLGGGRRSGRRGPAEPGELPRGQLVRAEEKSSSPTHEGSAGKQVSVWLGEKLGAKQSSLMTVEVKTLGHILFIFKKEKHQSIMAITVLS